MPLIPGTTLEGEEWRMSFFHALYFNSKTHQQQECGEPRFLRFFAVVHQIGHRNGNKRIQNRHAQQQHAEIGQVVSQVSIGSGAHRRTVQIESATDDHRGEQTAQTEQPLDDDGKQKSEFCIGSVQWNPVKSLGALPWSASLPLNAVHTNC